MVPVRQPRATSSRNGITLDAEHDKLGWKESARGIWRIQTSGVKCTRHENAGGEEGSRPIAGRGSSRQLKRSTSARMKKLQDISNAAEHSCQFKIGGQRGRVCP